MATFDSKPFVKPEKPDEEAFKKAVDRTQKEHDAIRQKLNDIKAKIEVAKPGGRDARSQEILDQLSQIKSQVASKKGALGKIQDEIRSLHDSINSRVKELQAKQKTMNYRTIADLEAAVARLDKQVSSGSMKIVEEKKALAEISTLNKQKRNFAAFDEAQKAIDADKAKLKELKEKKQDPELAELNMKYETLQNELNERRAGQESAQRNINSLRDERSRLHDQQQAKWEELKELKDNYHQNRIAFREWNKEAKKIRDERYAKQRAEHELERKKKIAAERMETASEPAFTSEIIVCEGLIGFFDPSSAEAAKKAKHASTPRELAAKAQRTVDDSQLKGKKLVKVEEDYFAGTGGKKKGKKGRSVPAAEAEKESVPVAIKFNLNVGVLEELTKVGVSTPSSKEEVPKTLEELRKKLQWYKDNQEKVTKENIEKAKKELEKFEKEEAEDAEAPAAVDSPKTPEAEEKVEETKEEEEEEEEEEKPEEAKAE